MSEWQNTVTTIVVAFLTFVVGPSVVGWFAWKRGKRQAEAAAEKDISSGARDRAESDVSVAGAVFQWSDRLREQVESLEEKLKGTEAQVTTLKQELDDMRRKYERVLHHNYLLIRQLEELGEIPVEMPDIEPWREYALVDRLDGDQDE